MNIGFFGDSFCNNKSEGTYIDMLVKQYGLNVVNLGVGGSGVEDVLLLQLKPFLDSKNYPDICVFFWTNHGRLFNRHIRHINAKSVEMFNDNPIWLAAKEYYKHLYDYEYTEIQYKAFLQYVDLNVLSQFPSTTKIIHLWSFGSFHCDFSKEALTPDKVNYLYRFKSGVEIQPALLPLSLVGQSFDMLPRDTRYNHLEGYKNEIVTSWIKEAIDKYEVGKLLTFNY